MPTNTRPPRNPDEAALFDSLWEYIAKRHKRVEAISAKIAELEKELEKVRSESERGAHLLKSYFPPITQ